MGNQHGRSWDQVGRGGNQDGRNGGYLPGKGEPTPTFLHR